MHENPSDSHRGIQKISGTSGKTDGRPGRALSLFDPVLDSPAIIRRPLFSRLNLGSIMVSCKQI
ncbi:MAG: hypothetical protein CMN02_06880 [Roseibacillus sp.]|nr:hypothetical protein [Roseibacillus sp.]